MPSREIRPGTLDHFSREYPGASCTKPAISVRVGGVGPPTVKSLCRLALAYGHCGKKFAEKVPGEVSQVPAPGADSETFV
jgi:hypothetical protein